MTWADGYTALMAASRKGHVEVVRLLLARQGVEVNKTTPDGITALMVASYKGQVEVARLLLARQDVESVVAATSESSLTVRFSRPES